MGRKDKLKLENMKKANQLLDTGHGEKYPAKKTTPLKPSPNVTANPKTFVNKMSNLKD